MGSIDINQKTGCLEGNLRTLSSEEQIRLVVGVSEEVIEVLAEWF
jgi:hypothetical protein